MRLKIVPTPAHSPLGQRDGNRQVAVVRPVPIPRDRAHQRDVARKQLHVEDQIHRRTLRRPRRLVQELVH